MKGISRHALDATTYVSTPTPTETAMALRFTGGVSFLAALVFGMQGGWFALLCMALTLLGVFFFGMAKVVLKG